MKRKIIRQGNNTLTITLPKVWTNDYNINQGDEINLELRGSTLILCADGILSCPKQTKDISKLTSILPLVLLSLYRKGYDEIELRFENPQLVIFMHNLLNKIGYNIIDHGKNWCLIKALSEVDGLDFDEMLRKLFLSIKLKLEKIAEAVNKKEVYSLQGILAMSGIPSNITNFCYRLLSKRKLKKPEKTLYYQSIVTNLENLDIQLNLLINLLSNIHLQINSEQLFKSFKEFEELYSYYYSSHFNSGLENFSSLINRKSLLHENINIMANQFNRDEGKIFLLLNNSYIYLENLINTSFLLKL